MKIRRLLKNLKNNVNKSAVNSMSFILLAALLCLFKGVKTSIPKPN